jgi:hypothetical protein
VNRDTQSGIGQSDRSEFNFHLPVTYARPLLARYQPLKYQTFHTARAAMRPINTPLEHVFTTFEIRAENATARKPAWILEPCLRLY